MQQIYLALGTNLGDRESNLAKAIEQLSIHCPVVAISSIFETEPWGYLDQGKFLNMVVGCETSLSPLSLLDFVKNLEGELGRTPNFRNGPRLIDIDILFYGDQVIDKPGLAIPHPRLHERAFVLVPLAEIAPTLLHPVTGFTIEKHLKDVTEEGIMLYKKNTGFTVQMEKK